MGRRTLNTLLAAGALIVMAFAADPALAKQCRDAAGNVMGCPAAPVAKSSRCVSLRTSKPTKCSGPDAAPVVKGPVAGSAAKKP